MIIKNIHCVSLLLIILSQHTLVRTIMKESPLSIMNFCLYFQSMIKCSQLLSPHSLRATLIHYVHWNASIVSKYGYSVIKWVTQTKGVILYHMTSLLRYLQQANTQSVVTRQGQTGQNLFNRNRAQHRMMKKFCRQTVERPWWEYAKWFELLV